jgi:hypothetical protein
MIERRIYVKWLAPAILLVAVSAFANDGSDIIRMKNNVTFPHRAHQGYNKSDCKQCHKKEIGNGHIPGFSKDGAHRMCRTCHAMKNAGPVSCKECHPKTVAKN